MPQKDAVPPRVDELRHPHYLVNELNWFKWRLTALGGNEFLRRYLVKFSRLEDDTDFQDRKQLSYVPAFAKKALNKVKNAIFQRLSDVVRSGGPKSYQDACDGTDTRGVDMHGSSMSTYIGREILNELLPLARVGVYVDMPPKTGPTIADRGNRRPYLYTYRAEHIRSWAIQRDSDPSEFTALLLEDTDYVVNERWLLPFEMVNRYRWVWIDKETGKVNVQFYNQQTGDKGEIYWAGDEVIELDIEKIPFVVFEISDSLVADAADYQIALLNLASSSIMYAAKSNHPIYTEQVDWRTESPHLKQGSIARTQDTNWNQGSSQITVNLDQIREIRTGAMGGRQYPKDTERPGFIHPSSEPLIASMAKEEQMKKEIEELVTHSLSSLTPTTNDPSVTSDEKGEAAGLQYIGLSLEHGERKIAEYWAMYEGEKPAIINYPKNFSLLSEEDRRAHAAFLKELIPKVQSPTYQRVLMKQLAEHTTANRTDPETMAKIYSEIDKSVVIYGDPEVILKDLIAGIVSKATASKARGYPDGEVEKANEEHAQRIQAVAMAQTPGQGYGALADTAQARGAPDLGANPQAGKQEKHTSQKDHTMDTPPHKKTRGPGNA